MKIFLISIVFITSVSCSFALAKEDVDAEIMKYRTREVTLSIRGKDGEILSNRDVTVEMTGHSFLFGCNMYLWDSPDVDGEKQKAYRDLFSRLFNYATLPFYWSEYEQTKENYKDDIISNAALWCREKKISIKGHPLIWHNFIPLWADRSTSGTENLLEERVKKIIGKYRGLIGSFDIINEGLEGPDYDNSVGRWERETGPIEAARRSISWAREQDPEALLIINDSDISPSYADEISVLKEFGFSPDAIGITSYMHKGTWTDEKILNTVKMFARYSIPVHFTGLAILSGRLKTDDDWSGFHPGWISTSEGEKYQASETERIYRLLFSCPSVTSVTWWDFSDYNSWQGAPSGLLRKDMSPKPAFEILDRLIKHEWWTGPLHLTSDANGRVSFRGFLGTYKAETGGKKSAFNLTSDTITAIFR